MWLYVHQEGITQRPKGLFWSIYFYFYFKIDGRCVVWLWCAPRAHICIFYTNIFSCKLCGKNEIQETPKSFIFIKDYGWLFPSPTQVLWWDIDRMEVHGENRNTTRLGHHKDMLEEMIKCHTVWYRRKHIFSPKSPQSTIELCGVFCEPELFVLLQPLLSRIDTTKGWAKSWEIESDISCLAQHCTCNIDFYLHHKTSL